MHERLRLSCTCVEDGAGAPEERADVGVAGRETADPGDEAAVAVEAREGDVFFYRDGKAVEGADGAAVLFDVVVELGGAKEGASWEKLG